MSRRNSVVDVQSRQSPGIVGLLYATLSATKSKAAATKTVEELQRRIEIRDASRIKKEPLSSLHSALPPHLRRNSQILNSSIDNCSTTTDISSSTSSTLKQAKERAEEVAARLATHKAEVQSLSTQVDENENTLTGQNYNFQFRVPTPVDIVSAEIDEDLKKDANIALVDAMQRKKMREVAALQRKQRRESLLNTAITLAPGTDEKISLESTPYTNIYNKTTTGSIKEIEKEKVKEEEENSQHDQKFIPPPPPPPLPPPPSLPPSSLSVSNGAKLSKRMAASDFLKMRRDGKDNSVVLNNTTSHIRPLTTNKMQELDAHNESPFMSKSIPSLIDPVVVNIHERSQPSSNYSLSSSSSSSPSSKVSSPIKNVITLPLPSPPSVIPSHSHIEQEKMSTISQRRPSFSGISYSSVQKNTTDLSLSTLISNTKKPSSSSSIHISRSTSKIMKPFTRMFAREGLRSHAVAAGMIMRPPPSHLSYSSTLMILPQDQPLLPLIDTTEVDMIEQTLLKACEVTNTQMPESIKSVLTLARTTTTSTTSTTSTTLSSYSSPRSIQKSSRKELNEVLTSPNLLQSPIKLSSMEQYEENNIVLNDNHLLENSLSTSMIIQQTPQSVSKNTQGKGVVSFNVTTSRKKKKNTEEVIEESNQQLINKEEDLVNASVSEKTVVDVEKQLEKEFVDKLHRLHPPLPPPLFALQTKKSIEENTPYTLLSTPLIAAENVHEHPEVSTLVENISPSLLITSKDFTSNAVVTSTMVMDENVFPQASERIREEIRLTKMDITKKGLEIRPLALKIDLKRFR
jgi:hypothetical protein